MIWHFSTLQIRDKQYKSFWDNNRPNYIPLNLYFYKLFHITNFSVFLWMQNHKIRSIHSDVINLWSYTTKCQRIFDLINSIKHERGRRGDRNYDLLLLAAPNARNRIHSHSFLLDILFLLYNLVVASKPTQTVSYGEDFSLGSYIWPLIFLLYVICGKIKQNC